MSSATKLPVCQPAHLFPLPQGEREGRSQATKPARPWPPSPSAARLAVRRERRREPERQSNKTCTRCEVFERGGWSGSVMRNHFRRRQRAQLAALRQALAVSQAVQESSRELIARTGSVHHLGNRRGVDLIHHAF